MGRHDVTDEQWGLIADLFPKRARTGRPPKEHRLMLSGIFWSLSTGAQWRDLPERYGPWKTVYSRFSQWRDSGLFDRLLARLHAKLDEQGRLDFGLWCVDGSIARATRSAAGAPRRRRAGEPSDHALGKSRGGFSTKFHLVCDGSGLPLAVELTPGQTHESKAFERVMNSTLELVGVETTPPSRKAAAKIRRRGQGL